MRNTKIFGFAGSETITSERMVFTDAISKLATIKKSLLLVQDFFYLYEMFIKSYADLKSEIYRQGVLVLPNASSHDYHKRRRDVLVSINTSLFSFMNIGKLIVDKINCKSADDGSDGRSGIVLKITNDTNSFDDVKTKLSHFYDENIHHYKDAYTLRNKMQHTSFAVDSYVLKWAGDRMTFSIPIDREMLSTNKKTNQCQVELADLIDGYAWSISYMVELCRDKMKARIEQLISEWKIVELDLSLLANLRAPISFIDEPVRDTSLEWLEQDLVFRSRYVV